MFCGIYTSVGAYSSSSQQTHQRLCKHEQVTQRLACSRCRYSVNYWHHLKPWTRFHLNQLLYADYYYRLSIDWKSSFLEPLKANHTIHPLSSLVCALAPWSLASMFYWTSNASTGEASWEPRTPMILGRPSNCLLVTLQRLRHLQSHL